MVFFLRLLLKMCASLLTMLNLKELNKPAPRYTSYPTPPAWGEITPSIYVDDLQKGENDSLSLYVHIPFCESMCLFCGCSVILNRKIEKEKEYVAYLCKEIDLIAACFQGKKRVSQLHFGGGTP